MRKPRPRIQLPRARPSSRSLALATAVAVLSGCGGSRTGLPLSRWLSSSSARKTVSLTLVAGYDEAYNGFNFNGYGKGQVLVSVPRGWRVTVHCENRGSGRHSCAVVRGPGALQPAFPGAESPRLPAGRSASFSFTAAAVGTYRLACLVPRHEQAGEWDVFEVTAGRRPSVRLLRPPP